MATWRDELDFDFVNTKLDFAAVVAELKKVIDEVQAVTGEDSGKALFDTFSINLAKDYVSQKIREFEKLNKVVAKKTKKTKSSPAETS